MSQNFLVPTNPEIFFRGRPNDPRLGDFVKPVGQLPPLQQKAAKEIVAIIGFPDDEGVTRNRGRAGAKGGPDGIRKHLYKLCPPMDFDWEKSLEVFDVGNLVPSSPITDTHDRAQESVRALAERGSTVIALGGGHDFAAPTCLGAAEGFQKFLGKKSAVGLINIDPHLDVRPLEANLPHSGTPFRVILEKKVLKSLSAFGIRTNRNARDHYQYAVDNGMKIFTLDTLRLGKKSVESAFDTEIKRLAKTSAILGVTLDLDSCFEAEGSSAAPVLGFSTWEICRFAYRAGLEPKVKWFELAEAAPSLDPTERIGRIAAEAIFYFLLGRAEKRSPKSR
jgi:formiminoglutamase